MIVVVANAYSWIQEAALKKKKLIWARSIRDYDKVVPPPEFKATFDALQSRRKELLKNRVDQKLANADHFVKNMTFAATVLKDSPQMKKMIVASLKLHSMYIVDLKRAREMVQ